ncbi:hypothetical protein LCGC14_1479410 [marine sediment metagenome]|uniref:AAA+ ATPase domain-containing protein n=1 Tax=marine sediment metagenome TaxID=412755 RepID=A0A0F9JVX5_9ZZZZ
MIVSGWAGCGKSTIVFLLQKLLDAELIYRIPEQLNEPEEIVKILNQINSNKKLTILFLDEIHQLKQKTGELFYPILEDFIISEKNIKPFIFAGATTNLDIIQTKLSPLYDRIHFKIHLTKYDEQELTTIISNYKKQLYPDIKIKKEDLKIIAKNAKQTPRIAIALLLKLLVEKDIQTVLEQEDIIYEGLNKTDVKIMGTLNEFNKPIGSKALSQVVGITEKDYLVIYENYLCEKKFIIRTSRGRILTEKGKKILKEL